MQSSSSSPSSSSSSSPLLHLDWHNLCSEDDPRNRGYV
jgi:hypothetical protein